MRLTQRLQLVKFVVLITLFISVILTYSLWAGERFFPKTSLITSYDGISAPIDYIHLSVLLGLIIFSFMSQKNYPTILLIVFGVYLCTDDQNRLQYWFYIYLFILGIHLFYKNRVDEPNNYTTVFISLQILIALIYVFSGIQKLNTHYVPETFKWIGHSLDFLLSERQVEKAYKFSYAMPYIELTLGIGLLYKPARYIVLPLVIIMHVFNIILLVFITKDTNYMFLPWNIIMIALVLLLFANVEQERFFDISILFKGTNFYIVITLMLIFPFFSLRNQYDSFLSNAVSSSNLNSCEILLSHKAYQKLPYYIRSFTTNRKNEYILNVEEWAKHELKSPCVPEYRIFKKVRRYLIQLTQTNSQEIKFKFIERERIMP